MINSTLKKIFLFTIFSRKKIFKPKLNKLLIFDQVGSNILKKSLPNYNPAVLSIRGEELNLFIIFSVLLSQTYLIIRPRLFWKAYIDLYIKEVNPKIILTYIDNNHFFYSLKNKFPNIKFFSIQNGYRFSKGDLFGEFDNLKYLKNKKNYFKCDYIFCFNKQVAKLYKKNIDCKTVTIGSFKNNLIENKNRKKNNVFLLISSFGLGNLDAEKKLLPIIQNFCNNNKINFSILGRTSQSGEEIFYNSFKKKYPINFQKNLGKSNFKHSYNTVDKARVVLSLNATLGYESLSRKNKTIFLNFKDRDLNCNSYLSFGWPLKMSKNGKFWISTFNKKKINKIFNDIYKMSYKNWIKNCYPISKKIISYDNGNKTFLKKVNNVF